MPLLAPQRRLHEELPALLSGQVAMLCHCLCAMGVARVEGGAEADDTALFPAPDALVALSDLGGAVVELANQ